MGCDLRLGGVGSAGGAEVLDHPIEAFRNVLREGASVTSSTSMDHAFLRVIISHPRLFHEYVLISHPRLFHEYVLIAVEQIVVELYV